MGGSTNEGITSGLKRAKYEEGKRVSLLEKHPEEDRESLSKLDLDTLEYVTNKINDRKPNIPEIAGTTRKSSKELSIKDFASMTKEEKKKNWDSFMNQYKK